MTNLNKSQHNKIDNIRHSLAHLLAAAVRALYPGAMNAIGPAIKNGFYQDFELPKPISQDDLPKIEAKMRELLPQWTKWTKKVVTLKDVEKEFGWNRYRMELAKEFARDKKTLTFYTCGGLIDLCKGGHAFALSEIDPHSFKLDRVAGAYWRGDEKNKMLTRIYGVAFETKKELDHYLWQQEEAKKRDHRILGERLRLFTFAEEVGPGLPLWLPNGMILRDTIETYAKKIEEEQGYQRVATPHIAKEKLYKISGHIPYYAESMYPPMELDDGKYYLKAMNCPHTHMIYKSQPHSYRELPIRYAEYGTVYRYELSGTLAGLLRTRGFTQNDAHIYCREDQAEEEFLKVMQLHEFWYKKVFGITDFYMRLSLPTKDKKKYAGVPAGWTKAIALVRNAMKKSGLPYIETEGEAAFYGPKVDFQIKSVIGREETASTNQLDFVATERFGLTYKDRDGKDKPVYVIHRAPLGSHERFIAFLIEQYAGAFPFWLAPVQVAVLAINEKVADYAQKVFEELKKNNIRAELDLRNESIGKKIREAELQKIPYLLVIGQKEVTTQKIAVRERGLSAQAGKGDIGQKTLEEFLAIAK